MDFEKFPIHVDEWWNNATSGEKNALIEKAFPKQRFWIAASGNPPDTTPLDYCTDIAAAWKIHGRMCETPFSTRQRYLKEIQAYSWMKTGLTVAWPDVLSVLREDMPDAICLAAIKAIGITQVDMPIAAFGKGE